MSPKLCIKQNNKKLLPILPFAKIFNDRISGKQFHFLNFPLLFILHLWNHLELEIKKEHKCSKAASDGQRTFNAHSFLI